MHKRFARKMMVSIVSICLLVISVGCSSSAGNLTTFSQANGNYDGHAWSPDGQWLASEETDASKLALFAADGTLVNELRLGCDLGTGVDDFSWLPDGRLSCFSDNQGATLDLFTLDQRGQVKQRTAITVAINPGVFIYGLQWNPKHFWLAVLADKASGETAPQLSLYDLEGHSLISPMSINAETLAWSPDGTMLALTESGGGDIFLLKIQPTKTGEITVDMTNLLTAGASDIGNLAWSPSGRWLVCRHASYDSEDYLFLYATDGSGKQVKLTSSTTDGQLDNPAWSPDGKTVVVIQIAMSGDVLMKLDMVSLLKEKGVTP